MPDDSDIYPYHCKIGISRLGYYVKDLSQKQNQMKFIVGNEKPFMLDYKMIIEIADCKFYIK